MRTEDTPRGRMRAAVLHAPRDLRLQEIPVPEPEADEVLVRILANGICGSDLHFYEDGRLGPYRVSRPYVPGHEASGVVVRAARDGRGPSLGTRVALEPGIPCRRCPWCKSGRYNLCPDVVFLSAPPVDGTLSEYVALPADFAHPVPEGVGDEEAAFVEPVAVAVQAAKRSGLTAGMSIAILGCGPIGLLTLLVCRAYGATSAYLFDRLPNRLELARSLGATEAVDVSSRDALRSVQELTRGRGVDVVFDTSGSASACRTAPLLAARGGVVTMVGYPESESIEYPVVTVIERELDVRGVQRYANAYAPALALLGSGRLEVKPLVSHRFAFAQVCEAFRFASENRSITMKVMVGGAG